MKTKISLGLCLAIAISLLAGPGYSNETLVEQLNDLNAKIETAFSEGRQWSKFPGGLSAFLFGPESVVGPGEIYFPPGKDSGKNRNSWHRAYTYKSDHGPCLISHIEFCDKSAAREYLDRRDRLRSGMRERLGFDYFSDGPLDLLKILKTREGSKYISLLPQFGWVKESDLPALIRLLDSTDPCANVHSFHSSYIDTSRSTIGNEAAYLIEGFRLDQYPPGLNSTRPCSDTEELKIWWKERSGT